MITPWQPVIFPKKPGILGENLVMSNPWFTRDRPVIYPWQPGFECAPNTLIFLGEFMLDDNLQYPFWTSKKGIVFKIQIVNRKRYGRENPCFWKKRVFSTKPGFPGRTSVLLANPGYFKGLEAQGIYFSLEFSKVVEISSRRLDLHKKILVKCGMSFGCVTQCSLIFYVPGDL